MKKSFLDSAAFFWVLSFALLQSQPAVADMMKDQQDYAQKMSGTGMSPQQTSQQADHQQSVVDSGNARMVDSTPPAQQDVTTTSHKGTGTKDDPETDVSIVTSADGLYRTTRVARKWHDVVNGVDTVVDDLVNQTFSRNSKSEKWALQTRTGSRQTDRNWLLSGGDSKTESILTSSRGIGYLNVTSHSVEVRHDAGGHETLNRDTTTVQSFGPTGKLSVEKTGHLTTASFNGPADDPNTEFDEGGLLSRHNIQYNADGSRVETWDDQVTSASGSGRVLLSAHTFREIIYDIKSNVLSQSIMVTATTWFDVPDHVISSTSTRRTRITSSGTSIQEKSTVYQLDGSYVKAATNRDYNASRSLTNEVRGSYSVNAAGQVLTWSALNVPGYTQAATAQEQLAIARGWVDAQ